MGEYFEQIPEKVKKQIKDITKSSGMDSNEDSLEMMARAWVEKKEVFEEQIEKMNMEECEVIDKDDSRGALVLTYSGSLINIGPLVDDVRNAEYTSIGLRSDVPDSISNNSSKLGEDIAVDNALVFEEGPVKSTSAIYKIAVFKDEMDAEEEEERLYTATMTIADEFAEINKTIIAQ